VNPLLAAFCTRPGASRDLGGGDSGWPVGAGTLGFWAGVTILFGPALVGLASLAAESKLHSHVLLIPFLSGFLLWNHPSLREIRRVPAPRIGGAFLTAGLFLAIAAWSAEGWSETDRLALFVLAYVVTVAGGGFLFQGTGWMRAAAFPICFLLFLIPLPDGAVEALELVLTRATVELLVPLFHFVSMPLEREGATFHLPGISLEVARECSGIRSTWVLLVTAVLVSHMLLSRPSARLVLVALVVPLGIVRNVMRVFTIALFCVHGHPSLIDSPIHTQGGPLFFALSLVPFALLVVVLRRSERGASGQEASNGDRKAGGRG